MFKHNQSTTLRPGDWVRVRTSDQILDTLDKHGLLGSLPFMPEMLQYVGQKFQVQSRAESACASRKVTAIRRLRDTVHLNHLRCDGSSHGGCQSACLLFWKEAWLEKTTPPSTSVSNSTLPATKGNTQSLLPIIQPATYHDSGKTNHYSCQATQLWQATDHLPIWSLSQYLRPIFRNRISAFNVAKGVFRNFATKIASVIARRISPPKKNKKTPQRRLNLQVGELVQVQTAEKIAATLDANGKNRGMWFDPQMYQHCGKTYRVTAKIQRMIEEGTGRLIELQSPTVTLESVACDGCWHRFCTREAPLFWREIWLQRVKSETPKNPPVPTPKTILQAPNYQNNVPEPVAVQD